MDWRAVKRNEPGAPFVLLATIWTFAYTELGEELMELKCRLCAMGDQQRDANGAVVAGIGEDELLCCVLFALADSSLRDLRKSAW